MMHAALVLVAAGAFVLPASAEHMQVYVDTPEGSSFSGCQQTDTCFIPSTALIDAGSEVVWTNSDISVHTVTSGTASAGPDGTFDSRLIPAGAEFVHRFGEDGTYTYFCLLHPWMEGVVLVGVSEYKEDRAGDGIPEDEPEGAGGCLIATAAYGSELAPQVQLLREIRDGVLLPTASGASFVAGFNQVYYSFSPAVADLELENPAFRDAVRSAITPGVYALGLMALADPASEYSIAAYGILSLAALAGIYVAGPVLAAVAVKRTLARTHRRAPNSSRPGADSPARAGRESGGPDARSRRRKPHAGG